MSTRTSLKLTHAGVATMMAAAVAKAESMGVPQNIWIVDESGHPLAFTRMDGAKFLSIETSRAKALSAASHRQPTGRLDPALDMKFAIATDGRLTNLEGGLPVMIEGQCVGAIGVGSGKGFEDVEVATAALASIGAQTSF